MKVYIDGCFVGMMVVDYFLQVGVMSYPIFELIDQPTFFYILVTLAAISTFYRITFLVIAAVPGMVESWLYILFCGFRVVLCLCLFPVFAFVVCLLHNIQALYIYGVAGMIVTTIVDILYFTYLKTYHTRSIVETSSDCSVAYIRA